MDLDRILHEKKNFAELGDADLEEFLRERRFGTEYLNLEFKSGFPRIENQKFDIRKICKYIVGFSNEEGGLVIYGVADSIKEPSASFPTYIAGFDRHPSLEDLSQWAKDRIHPLIDSPSIRFFTVIGKKLAVLKVPSGANKPYCYLDPKTKSLTYFKKTSGGIEELMPDQVSAFYRAQMIKQANDILRASKISAAIHEEEAPLPGGARALMQRP